MEPTLEQLQSESRHRQYLKRQAQNEKKPKSSGRKLPGPSSGFDWIAQSATIERLKKAPPKNKVPPKAPKSKPKADKEIDWNKVREAAKRV